jgi:hypothetical protein
VPYTVVGGPPARGAPEGSSLSVLLLGRGNRLYRNDVLHDLERLGLDSIVWIEEGVDALDVESLAQRHPGTRFVLLGGPVSVGERINVGMRESASPYVFVLWSDMKLQAAGLSGRFFERLGEQKLLCLAPWLQAGRGDVLPCAVSPALHRQSLKLLPLPPAKDGARTIYPVDFCGIYSRERFILTGGFDGGIRNPYWQKLDFGFRAWLWGEEIRLSQALRVGYEDSPTEEDSTPDDDYKWFWLKNLAPSYRSDHAAIAPRRYWAYLRRRRGNPLAALSEFRAATEWVKLNRFRFGSDASSLVDLWEEENR